MVTFPNAKINIGLDVLRKRPDGFHDLESLFVPYMGLQDKLEITEAAKFSVEIMRGGRVMDGRAAGDWDPRKDLTVKAWELLRRECGIGPVKIHLEKNIPVGAGLGGGSADAAFALVMLSEMFDLYLPDTMLEIFAAELGSDCPFFVYNRPMFVSGRGEELEPMDVSVLENYELRVVIPEGIAVSTKEAYAGIVPGVPQMALADALNQPIATWKDNVKNDFERTVFAAHPELAAIKQRLYDEGAVYAAMSGSGSAMFGIFKK